jgi:CRISPR type III-associated protein (TIGR04423 family)
MENFTKEADMKQLNNEGYIWLSDANKPIIIEQFETHGDGINISFDGCTATITHESCILMKNGEAIKIPFIIEALFVVNNVSYQIKFVDGKYIVYSKNLDDVSDTNSTAITYLPNRFDDSVKGLNFCRLWEEKADPLCEGMNVLVPTVDLFVGFKKISHAE